MRRMNSLLPLMFASAFLAQDAEPERPNLNDLEIVQLATGMGFNEGPVWLHEEQSLVFSDKRGSKLMQWSESEGVELLRESQTPIGNALDAEGRLLTCRQGARDIVRTNKDGTVEVVINSYEGKRLNSPNHLTVGPDGSLWFTDPPWGLNRLSEGKELEGQWVFRVQPDGTVTRAVSDLAMPNGIALSPEGDRLYVSDTGGNPLLDEALQKLPPTLSAYEILPNGNLNPKPLWRVETRCYGICVDEHGNVYTAENWISIRTPEGDAIGTIRTPEQPGHLCFGGPDHQTLFFTARPSLYAVKLDVKGIRPATAKQRKR